MSERETDREKEKTIIKTQKRREKNTFTGHKLENNDNNNNNNNQANHKRNTLCECVYAWFSFHFVSFSCLLDSSPSFLWSVFLFSIDSIGNEMNEKKMGTSVALTAKRKNTPPKIAFSAPIFPLFGISITPLFKTDLYIEKAPQNWEQDREWRYARVRNDHKQDDRCVCVCVTLECVSTGREGKAHKRTNAQRHAKYLYLHPNSLRLLYHPKMAA